MRRLTSVEMQSITLEKQIGLSFRWRSNRKC